MLFVLWVCIKEPDVLVSWLRISNEDTPPPNDSFGSPVCLLVIK